MLLETLMSDPDSAQNAFTHQAEGFFGVFRVPVLIRRGQDSAPAMQRPLPN